MPLLRYSGGDARKLLNIPELVVEAGGDSIEITDSMVEERLQQNPLAYDKGRRDALRHHFGVHKKAFVAAIPMRRFIGWHA